jgi:hypothetical protein
MSFVRYNPEDSVISSETVVRGLFSGDTGSLTTFFTASGYTEYYLDVYNANPTTNASASVQFTVQYGNLYGSGSALLNSQVTGASPSRIVYGQYRNLVYGTETTNFSFDGGTTTANDIYVINFSRARYKESLLPGSLNIGLRSGSAQLYLTDDSNVSNTTNFIGENRYYNIISGSNGSAYTGSAATTYYGMFLPDINVVILKASGSNSVSPYAAPITSSFAANYNALKLFSSVSASGVASIPLTVQSSETVSSRYFFTRVKNGDFNYTTNPSIIDANGNILYTTLINNPQTYVTTVGLYNDNNDLLAVAKLSKPLVKDFTKEALIRVKLDY